MKKFKHALAIGLPIAAGLYLAVKPFVPASYVGLAACFAAVVNYLLESPLVKEEP